MLSYWRRRASLDPKQQSIPETFDLSEQMIAIQNK